MSKDIGMMYTIDGEYFFPLPKIHGSENGEHHVILLKITVVLDRINIDKLIQGDSCSTKAMK